MKAKLEVKEMQYRGVSLISETEEEKQVLTNLWNQKSGPVMLGRMGDGQVQLIIAPKSGPAMLGRMGDGQSPDKEGE